MRALKGLLGTLSTLAMGLTSMWPGLEPGRKFSAFPRLAFFVEATSEAGGKCRDHSEVFVRHARHRGHHAAAAESMSVAGFVEAILTCASRQRLHFVTRAMVFRPGRFGRVSFGPKTRPGGSLSAAGQ